MTLVRNGWEIYFYRPLFGQQREELRKKVRKLKSELSESEYVSHSDVKLLAAVMAGIKEKITLDPFADHFALIGPLKKYGRLKKMGLDSRYRLFFKAFDTGERKVLIILWLGYPRKDGDKNDCYTVFKKMVAQGRLPESMEELLAKSE